MRMLPPTDIGEGYLPCTIRNAAAFNLFPEDVRRFRVVYATYERDLARLDVAPANGIRVAPAHRERLPDLLLWEANRRRELNEPLLTFDTTITGTARGPELIMTEAEKDYLFRLQATHGDGGDVTWLLWYCAAVDALRAEVG